MKIFSPFFYLLYHFNYFAFYFFLLFFVLLYTIYYGICLTQYPHKWWFCSNDDPIFVHASLGNADEQWSSSKVVANSPVKTFPISVDSPSLASGEPRKQFEIKTEYLQHDDQAFTFGHGKIKDPALHDMQNAHGISDHVEYAGDKRKPVEKAQVLTILHCKMLPT